jgi:hypothetical protein
MGQYPILQLWVRYGDGIAIAVASLVILVGFWGVAVHGNWVWLVVAGVFASFGYLLIRSYAELVRLVTDMLLPK